MVGREDALGEGLAANGVVLGQGVAEGRKDGIARMEGDVPEVAGAAGVGVEVDEAFAPALLRVDELMDGKGVEELLGEHEQGLGGGHGGELAMPVDLQAIGGDDLDIVEVGQGRGEGGNGGFGGGRGG